MTRSVGESATKLKDRMSSGGAAAQSGLQSGAQSRASATDIPEAQRTSGSGGNPGSPHTGSQNTAKSPSKMRKLVSSALGMKKLGFLSTTSSLSRKNSVEKEEASLIRDSSAGVGAQTGGQTGAQTGAQTGGTSKAALISKEVSSREPSKGTDITKKSGPSPKPNQRSLLASAMSVAAAAPAETPLEGNTSRSASASESEDNIASSRSSREEIPSHDKVSLGISGGVISGSGGFQTATGSDSKESSGRNGGNLAAVDTTASAAAGNLAGFTASASPTLSLSDTGSEHASATDNINNGHSKSSGPSGKVAKTQSSMRSTNPRRRRIDDNINSSALHNPFSTWNGNSVLMRGAVALVFRFFTAICQRAIKNRKVEERKKREREEKQAFLTKEKLKAQEITERIRKESPVNNNANGDATQKNKDPSSDNNMLTISPDTNEDRLMMGKMAQNRNRSASQSSLDSSASFTGSQASEVSLPADMAEPVEVASSFLQGVWMSQVVQKFQTVCPVVYLQVRGKVYYLL
jgi:hypothetical protein